MNIFETDSVRNALPANPASLHGMEIGIGTGRFTIPLGIKEGIEPAEAIRKTAISNGLNNHAGFNRRYNRKNAQTTP